MTEKTGGIESVVLGSHWKQVRDLESAGRRVLIYCVYKGNSLKPFGDYVFISLCLMIPVECYKILKYYSAAL